MGKAFYNEFGNRATRRVLTIYRLEGWFHKIGVGLLQKDDAFYSFQKSYNIQPIQFEVDQSLEAITIRCNGPLQNGYAYVLQKRILLREDGFSIHYKLENRGQKPISTNEYNHNFLAINDQLLGSAYQLKFPFEIQMDALDAIVNDEALVDIQGNVVSFNGIPSEPFFFSNLSGGRMVNAQWTLENKDQNIGITESGDFQTNAINLWGCGHVVSPELFKDVQLSPEQSMQWTRSYHVYNID